MLPIKVNEHVVSIVLKELVRRAMIAIGKERFTFEATLKEGYEGDMDDVFTSEDIACSNSFILRSFLF